MIVLFDLDGVILDTGSGVLPISIVEPLSDHTLTDFTQMDYSKLSEIEEFL